MAWNNAFWAEKKEGRKNKEKKAEKVGEVEKEMRVALDSLLPSKFLNGGKIMSFLAWVRVGHRVLANSDPFPTQFHFK